MIKTEVCLSYQKPQGEQPCVVLTMRDFRGNGQTLTYVSKVTRQSSESYHEERSLNEMLTDCSAGTKELLRKYGGYIGSRVIGHLAGGQIEVPQGDQ